MTIHVYQKIYRDTIFLPIGSFSRHLGLSEFCSGLLVMLLLIQAGNAR